MSEQPQHLRAVRTLVDVYKITVDEAMERVLVPRELREQVRLQYEEETTVSIRPANVLSSIGVQYQTLAGWDSAAGYYWPRQRSYLIDMIGWSRKVVDSIDDDTDRILKHLADPRPSGTDSFSVRGLVMGYVQSGKTANYCALVAKAADAGYKLVIVLSGIHNTLRLQTQRRLSRALGMDPQSGVPQPEAGKRWIGLTTADLAGDFRPGTTDANVLQGNERVLIVCKKNASVLRRLTRWMTGRCPANLPVLIVDDEADQASVNTGGNRPPIAEETDLTEDDFEGSASTDEVDPSAINALVRSLVHSFRRVAYVAYTATPFANILINHLAIDRDVYEDLYPRDFIVALPKPVGYCGAERLFGRDTLAGETEALDGLDVIELIPGYEADVMTPSSASIAGYIPTIVPSLRTAMVDFFLAAAARQARSGKEEAATMLVHTHHRRAVQNELGAALGELVSELRSGWRYDKRQAYAEFSDRWHSRFVPVIEVGTGTATPIPFEQVVAHLDKLFIDLLPVLVLNSDSEDQLDYDRYPALKAVVVGGNRLSRGLTLEGLLVSYYVRRAGYFDTLMQMARWFGFREGYVDLTRIWTTAELAGWFRDLSLAEEELRTEIARYEREQLTPLDFGPRIRTHPAMMITARNKMGAARVVQQNYSASLIQTTMFRLRDMNWLQSNLAAGQALLHELGTPQVRKPNRLIWAEIPWQTVDGFLGTYCLHPDSRYDMGAIRQYLTKQTSENRELTEWSVAIVELASPDPLLGVEPGLAVDGRAVNRIARTRLRDSTDSIGTLVNPATLHNNADGDEAIGLTAEQVQMALEKTQARGDPRMLGRTLREQRSRRNGLLVLYPISPYSTPSRRNKNRLPLYDSPSDCVPTVLGIALVFPASESDATIEFVVGSVGHRADD